MKINRVAFYGWKSRVFFILAAFGMMLEGLVSVVTLGYYTLELDYLDRYLKEVHKCSKSTVENNNAQMA